MDPLAHSILPGLPRGDNKISKLQIIQQFTTIKDDPSCFISHDGSLCFFGEIIGGVDVVKIVEMMSKAVFGVAMQFYKVNKNRECNYYVSIKVSVDYTKVFKPYFYQYGMNPEKKTLIELTIATRKAMTVINRMKETCNVKPVDFYRSKLFENITGMTFEEFVNKKTVIRNDLSYILTGKKYSALFGLQNPGMYIRSPNLLKDDDYIQKQTIIIPSKERTNRVRISVLDHGSLLKKISKEAEVKRTVHVDTMTMDRSVETLFEIRGRCCYCSTTFMVLEENVEELRKTYSAITDKMKANKIECYVHGVSAPSEYLTFFPGNENVGDRYSLLFEYFVAIFLQGVFDL